MTPALETRDLTKIYDTGTVSVTAVDDVSFRIMPGEFVALVGPSGSGKTTLLAILAGLLSPTNGSVRIAGQPMEKLSDKQITRFRRRNIGFTFQSNNLVPYLTAVENVELMLRLNGQIRNGKGRAREILTRLGLADRLDALPRQLSGGQKQRVAIARSLIHDPAVVLADEPTASLDTERAYQVVDTFAELIHEQGRAGIMVTHDLRMVRNVDAVVRMVDGRLDTILRDRGEIAALAGAELTQQAAASEMRPALPPRHTPPPAYSAAAAGD